MVLVVIQPVITFQLAKIFRSQQFASTGLEIIIKLFIGEYSVRKLGTFYLHLIFPVMMLMMMIMMILMMTDEFAKIFSDRW